MFSPRLSQREKRGPTPHKPEGKNPPEGEGDRAFGLLCAKSPQQPSKLAKYTQIPMLFKGIHGSSYFPLFKNFRRVSIWDTPYRPGNAPHAAIQDKIMGSLESALWVNIANCQ